MKIKEIIIAGIAGLIIVRTIETIKGRLDNNKCRDTYKNKEY